MHHFKQQISKIFFPEGLRENVSPGTAVALAGLPWVWEFP